MLTPARLRVFMLLERLLEQLRAHTNHAHARVVLDVLLASMQQGSKALQAVLPVTATAPPATPSRKRARAAQQSATPASGTQPVTDTQRESVFALLCLLSSWLEWRGGKRVPGRIPTRTVLSARTLTPRTDSADVWPALLQACALVKADRFAPVSLALCRATSALLSITPGDAQRAPLATLLAPEGMIQSLPASLGVEAGVWPALRWLEHILPRVDAHTTQTILLPAINTYARLPSLLD